MGARNSAPMKYDDVFMTSSATTRMPVPMGLSVQHQHFLTDSIKCTNSFSIKQRHIPLEYCQGQNIEDIGSYQFGITKNYDGMILSANPSWTSLNLGVHVPVNDGDTTIDAAAVIKNGLALQANINTIIGSGIISLECGTSDKFQNYMWSTSTFYNINDFIGLGAKIYQNDANSSINWSVCMKPDIPGLSNTIQYMELAQKASIWQYTGNIQLSSNLMGSFSFDLMKEDNVRHYDWYIGAMQTFDKDAVHYTMSRNSVGASFFHSFGNAISLEIGTVVNISPLFCVPGVQFQIEIERAHV